MVNDIIKSIEHYCAYQDRCHSEVRHKLITLGSRGQELETIIAHLIQEDFLNEERFAKSYVSGKYKLKKWGRNKITNALKKKQVSDYCIKKGLQEIDLDIYIKNLKHLINSKLQSSNSDKKDMYQKKRSVITYLLQKGYEYDLIIEYLDF